MAADRWGVKPTKNEKTMTPAQFESLWKSFAVKLLAGDPAKTPDGPYYVRCGRRMQRGEFCLQRLGHSAACAPKFANVCDAILPKQRRCVLNVGHRCECMPIFPRGTP